VKVLCSYCRKTYGEKEPLGDDRVTHGICSECMSYYGSQWSGESLGQFLDRYEFPVLAINREGRVMAANAAMEAMLGKDASEIRGLRGGEASECAYARLPEGCGRTVHCQRCAIRLTVEDTHATGQEHQRVPAVLDLDDERVSFLISTSLHGDAVHLVIEEVTGREPRDPDGSAPARPIR
jgi:PAS domain-containing protein